MELNKPPLPGELEISIIGPGYGEAIMIHIGSGRWILVDSCRSLDTEHPASLAYLRQLGVNYEDAVELIAITHWHQDHIDGIEHIVAGCPQATVVMSSAILSSSTILGMVNRHNQSPLTSSGIESLSSVLSLLETRKVTGTRFNSPKRAVADRRLLKLDILFDDSSIPIIVWALSPADAILEQATRALAENLITATRMRRRVASPSPNDESVTLWLQVGPHNILLGADLENTNHTNSGWNAVVNDSQVIKGKQAEVFKVPHHGSKNAHNESVWNVLLSKQPYAVVTPWYKGGKHLPTDKDINRIKSHTPFGFITAETRPKKANFRDRAVQRSLNEATRSSFKLRERWGHVRLRRSILDELASWEVELFGGATRLTPPG